jgi:hypothetical protein
MVARYWEVVGEEAMVALRGGDGTHEPGEGAVIAGGQWTVVGGGACLRVLIVLVDGVGGHSSWFVGGCSSWFVGCGHGRSSRGLWWWSFVI